jgi:hypothetical protein
MPQAMTRHLRFFKLSSFWAGATVLRLMQPQTSLILNEVMEGVAEKTSYDRYKGIGFAISLTKAHDEK